MAKKPQGSIAADTDAAGACEPERVGAGDAGKRQRVALFDNVKGILIVLVVFGHIMHPVHNTNPALSTCFDLIYLFHMPLFVLTSGLFAKGAWRNGKLNVNRMISFVMLGFAFQLALALINGATLTPARICAFTSAPWYLISMACWYGFTPVLARLGAKRGMAFSLLIACSGGLIDLSSGFMAISRTLAFLPWFAAGYYLTPGTLLELRQSKWAKAAVALAAIIALARVFNAHAYDWFFQMVYGDNPYELGTLLAGALAGTNALPPLPASAFLLVDGMLQKLTSLALGAVFSLAVLRLAPTGRSWLTTLGQRTLQVYVLHRLIRAWLTFHTPLYDFPWMNDPLIGTAIVAALAIGITAACALPVFERPFTAFLKIRWVKPHGKSGA